MPGLLKCPGRPSARSAAMTRARVDPARNTRNAVDSTDHKHGAETEIRAGRLAHVTTAVSTLRYPKAVVMAQPQKHKPIRVGVRELRANLSALLWQVRQGASILVMSRNEVIAEIWPPSGIERPRRVPGLLRGKIRMAEDFDVLPDGVLSAMEGNGD